MLNNYFSPALQQGVSLVETMVVAAIVLIMAMYGLPSFSEWIQNTSIKTAAESIQSGLQTARAEAVRRNARVEFELTGVADTAGETGWRVQLVNTGTIVQTVGNNQGTNSIKLTTTPVGATTVTFDGTGRFPSGAVTNADGSAFLTKIDFDSEKLAAAVSRDLSVVVTSGGQIRMCDPNVSTTGDPRKC